MFPAEGETRHKNLILKPSLLLRLDHPRVPPTPSLLRQARRSLSQWLSPFWPATPTVPCWPRSRRRLPRCPLLHPPMTPFHRLQCPGGKTYQPLASNRNGKNRLHE